MPFSLQISHPPTLHKKVVLQSWTTKTGSCEEIVIVSVWLNCMIDREKEWKRTCQKELFRNSQKNVKEKQCFARASFLVTAGQSERERKSENSDSSSSWTYLTCSTVQSYLLVTWTEHTFFWIKKFVFFETIFWERERKRERTLTQN